MKNKYVRSDRGGKHKQKQKKTYTSSFKSRMISKNLSYLSGSCSNWDLTLSTKVTASLRVGFCILSATLDGFFELIDEWVVSTEYVRWRWMMRRIMMLQVRALYMLVSGKRIGKFNGPIKYF
jgi:hypothetical protein